MYEDRPEKDTPQYILDELAEYGGLNPFGKPIWRVVLAQNCKIHCFGPRNETSKQRLEEMAKTDDPHAAATFEPDRVLDGEHWLPRYRYDGWILERWFPASTWGTRQQWESEKTRDGRTRLLAAYPAQGGYMKMAPNFAECPAWPSLAMAGDLKAAIRCYNVMRRNNPVNWPNELERMAKMEELERQNRADAYAEELSALYRESMDGILHSASLAAQAFRNVVAKHAAHGVNLGASEKWN